MADVLSPRRIVRARIGPRGRYKPRPAIILGRVSRPDGADKYKVVVCSHDFDREKLADNEVRLPEGPPWPHPLTKLEEPTVVVVDWLEEIASTEIERQEGEIPHETLLRILQALKCKYKTTDVNLLPAGGHIPQ